MTKEHIIILYDYYNYIDFNTLSKLEIKAEPKNMDAINIFALSNLMHISNKETGKNLTQEQKNYINKIIKHYETNKNSERN